MLNWFTFVAQIKTLLTNVLKLSVNCQISLHARSYVRIQFDVLIYVLYVKTASE